MIASTPLEAHQAINVIQPYVSVWRPVQPAAYYYFGDCESLTVLDAHMRAHNNNRNLLDVNMRVGWSNHVKHVTYIYACYMEYDFFFGSGYDLLLKSMCVLVGT
jgi:hypothetical protein